MANILASTEEDTDSYDTSIHGNPDALAWAKLFMKHYVKGFTVDESLMHTWFANAMMAMHDHIDPGSLNARILVLETALKQAEKQ